MQSCNAQFILAVLAHSFCWLFKGTYFIGCFSAQFVLAVLVQRFFGCFTARFLWAVLEQGLYMCSWNGRFLWAVLMHSFCGLL